ncbi:MAG: heat-inducible transcriptional repressor HrcA [Acidimicrobiales bacterium]
MLDERKASILTAVVQEYIETAQPVGSSAIARVLEVPASPATVRNDMATLESEGYLDQPHTSAGRIPTEKGYRFFVDRVGQTKLASPETRRVSDFFHSVKGEIEQLMAQTAGLLSNLTEHAAVVVDRSVEAATVRSVTLVELGPHIILVVVVLSTGVIDKHTVTVTADLDEVDLDRIRTVMAVSLVGQTLDRPGGMPLLGDERLDAAAAEIVDQINHDSPHLERVYVDGRSHVAASFDALDSVRSVLTILEQQLLVVSLLGDVVDRGMTVAIGAETGVEPLAGCSVVVSPFRVDGEHAGSIAVLGPTRMNYPQAMAAVEVVGRQLGRRLSEG